MQFLINIQYSEDIQVFMLIYEKLKLKVLLEKISFLVLHDFFIEEKFEFGELNKKEVIKIVEKKLAK